jgi:hypothetical protein
MLTQAELKSILHYNPETGIFTWAKSRRVKIGSIAGHVDKNNSYIRISIRCKLYQAHRLAWLYIYGELPTYHIDHINRVRHDNRIHNLREATHSQNLLNASIRSNNTSGFKGVIWHNLVGQWLARATVHGKRVRLGYFATAKEASIAYEHFCKHNHGKFYCDSTLNN